MEIDRNIFILNLNKKIDLITICNNYKYFSNLIDVEQISEICVNDLQELFNNYIHLFYVVYNFIEKCNQINELKKQDFLMIELIMLFSNFCKNFFWF